MSRKDAPDQADRNTATRARGVNVLVDAGAGTGKTTLLVNRILELVAPEHGGPPVPLDKIAAITFTRKAAGELKFRIREALLRALADPDASAARREQLSLAVSAIDTAWVGTIHAFADRLLRLRPVEAELSPSFDIVEDGAELHAETYDLLLQAVELGTLADELERPDLADRAREAEATIVDALDAGLRPKTVEHAHGEYVGLDRLFQRFVETRDVAPRVAPPPAPDMGVFRKLVGELERLVEDSTGELDGSRHVRHLANRLARLRKEKNPARILAELIRLDGVKADVSKGRGFGDDQAGYDAWKAWDGDTRKSAVRPGCLRDELAEPFHAWMARRLVRCAPVVVAAYERVKRRHRAVDQVDLLLELRNLLRDRKDVRAGLQALFDEILVDEFQDTDPLQAEIVLYLCEQGAEATSWRDVRLTPGKLSIVGDPKQSIYRFRRADIAVYAEVREIVRRGPHAEASLQANFRCAPGLIEWLNDRFDRLLGSAAQGAQPFDAEAGTVANVRLLAGRDGEADARVVTIPVTAPEDKVDPLRASEARALATFLRATVDQQRRRIVDPVTGELRPVRFGDVAILTAATTKLSLLFPELDRLGIPYAVRGSKLFLEDAYHRQFLLALRHLADPRDGVAAAAVLRAPFFSIDLDDLARDRVEDADPAHPGVARARAAKAFLADLRERRLSRSPGDTARDLLELTGFARTIALGPNGAQRLDALHELCLRLDAIAADEGLDFDGATQRMRGWVVDPIELDPPRPVGAEAVQILSIHQAKGLEFPVVAWWDGCAKLTAPEERSPFVVDRDGAAWALAMDHLSWSEPDTTFAAREQAYRDAERLRLVYVAATRARDLLVVPVPLPVKDDRITSALSEGSPSRLVDALEPFDPDDPPAWAKQVRAPPRPEPGDASALHARVEARWSAARDEVSRPRAAPTSVTAEAHREPEAEDDAGARFRRQSRHGPVFGDTVHRAIGLALADPALDPAAAVARIAASTGLAAARDEAAADVTRALDALGRVGLRRAPGPDLRLEYPVALATGGGAKLEQGYVDLVGRANGRLAVVDFKTDQPPPAGVDLETSHPAYVAQVEEYARVLVELGVAAPGTVDAGLLFTADGVLRWVTRGPDAP